MSVLEQVIDMRARGMVDQEVASSLQEQGISPRAINDALNQANIKSAVGTGNFEGEESGEAVPTPMEGIYKPKTRESGDYYPESSGEEQQEYSSQPATYQEFYPQQEEYSGGAGTDADTMIEIAGQVFNEKIKKIKQALDALEEFKAVYLVKADSMYERLKRIENSFDRLQIDILDRVGSYGRGIETVKKELEMVQDSFGKIANTAMDKAESREEHSHTHHIVHHKAPATEQHPSAPQHHEPPVHHTQHKVHKKSSSKSKKKK